MKLEFTLSDRISKQLGSELEAALTDFAKSIDETCVDPQHVYSSAKFAEASVCHLVVVRPKKPRIGAELSKVLKARLRAYLEAFEDRLPYGMPYCAFAVFPRYWMFFDFSVTFDARQRDLFAQTFFEICRREFASEPVRHYIWDDASRRHFVRVGTVEI